MGGVADLTIERDHVRVGRATVSPKLPVVSPRARAADAYGHVRSPAGAIPALRFEGQLRPAMMPPSTSTMAPVIQLDLSDSRNDTAFAMSSGLPTRPSGWKLAKLSTVSSSLSAGTKPRYRGVSSRPRARPR